MSDTPVILLAHPLPFGGASRFPAGWDVRVAPPFAGPAEVPAGLGDCDGLVTLLNDTVDRRWIDAAHPRLRLIANVGVGYNHIDWEYARDRGVIVTNTPGVLTEATADLAMALVLACSRRIVEADRFTREGRFRGWDLELLLGLELGGATLGVVGMGRIGRAVARRAAGFGMRILYTRSGEGDAGPLGFDARRATFEDLLAESDVVTLHCPLTPRTRKLFDDAAFAWMKTGAILVNTARGPVVDEAALARALRSGKLAAAGLDVYAEEPAIPPELLALPNVTVLPHIGSATEKARRAIVNMAVDNAVAFFTTGRALNPVG
ncbi:MAG: D-glycerate dehydrogenase [Acidobacteria bacterium]|nr:D-glycerate dehydrogenase [Acidobacteriota bacterium]